VAMMLRYSFDLEEEAKAVDKAVGLAIGERFLTADLVGSDRARSTREVGTFIAEAVSSRTP